LQLRFKAVAKQAFLIKLWVRWHVLLAACLPCADRNEHDAGNVTVKINLTISRFLMAVTDFLKMLSMNGVYNEKCTSGCWLAVGLRVFDGLCLNATKAGFGKPRRHTV
jgi:hypothetical protein